MSTKSFEASKYLTDVNGREYLEVKWRLLWLRTERPDAQVETELVKQGGGFALFRARVTLPGAGVATGWGSETADDFHDYIEKAETKALGRALAALGYGTQFCEDFAFSSEGAEQQAGRGAAQRVVDAPVAAPGRLSVVRDRAAGGPTPSQLKAIYAIGRKHNEAEAAIDERCRAVYGRAPAELSKRQASEFIDLLRRPAAAGARPG
jgi:hypothetical protein